MNPLFKKVKAKHFAIIFILFFTTGVSAQSVLFDFDSAPQYSSLPLSMTVGGITAHFAATGQGFSIQAANTMGFTPAGFSGLCIYPNSIYLADLLIKFDQALTKFSIMYAPQELGCDNSCTMRVTAYMSGAYVGTATMTATTPGTWPTDTLGCIFPQGFDSVVVHYDNPPPTCQDYGVIFMADNMRATQLITTSLADQNILTDGYVFPNPVSQSAAILFSLSMPENINVAVYDITGRFIKNLFTGSLGNGNHQVDWDVSTDAVINGLYLLRITGDNFSNSYELAVVK